MATAPANFSVSTLDKKLTELNSTLQSIQNMSQWIIHFRKNAKTIVAVWYKDIQKASSAHKLTLLYVANDVIQNSKKRGPELKTEFGKVLPRVFQLVGKEKDDSLHQSVLKVVRVWEERRVFEVEVLNRLKNILSSVSKRRTRSESDVKRLAPASKRVKLDDSPRETPPNQNTPPEPEELLKRMLAIEGEKSAENDLQTKQKIASFPPEVHDPDLLCKIKDKAAAEKLSERVEEAAKVLGERKEIQELLDSFIWQQKGLLKDAKKKLREHQEKMEKVSSVREELKSHVANLPDFKRLQQSTSNSLAPLPSVGDLFN